MNYGNKYFQYKVKKQVLIVNNEMVWLHIDY